MSSAELHYRPHATVARLISDVLSPPVLAAPGLMLAAWYCHDPRGIGYAALYFVAAVMTPVLYVVWMVRSGQIEDFHLPIRADRTRPFLVSVICGAVAWIVLEQIGAPRDFLVPILALLTQTLVLFAITLWWQVSIHTATTAGVVTFAVIACGPQSSVLFLLVPLVAWARIYLGRHTLAQTVAGSIVGCGCFALLPALRSLGW
jgi:membrane-associated phospholipid phosphatase